MFLQNSFGNLTVLSRVGLVLLSFIVYVLSFKVTEFSPDFLKYDGWIYLIFLPAGLKLFFILVFGIWGTIGDILGLVLMSSMFFADQPPWLWTVYGTTSGLASYYGVHWAKRIFNVSDSLQELRFHHIPLIVLFGNLFHGIVTISLLANLGAIPASNFWANSSAMIFGDFAGSFVVVFLFLIVIKVYKLTRFSF